MYNKKINKNINKVKEMNKYKLIRRSITRICSYSEIQWIIQSSSRKVR